MDKTTETTDETDNNQETDTTDTTIQETDAPDMTIHETDETDTTTHETDATAMTLETETTVAPAMVVIMTEQQPESQCLSTTDAPAHPDQDNVNFVIRPAMNLVIVLN